jgi:hypothetical protein
VRSVSGGPELLDVVGLDAPAPSFRQPPGGFHCWRNRHTTDPKLRKVIKRASTITRAKVA